MNSELRTKVSDILAAAGWTIERVQSLDAAKTISKTPGIKGLPSEAIEPKQITPSKSHRPHKPLKIGKGGHLIVFGGARNSRPRS